MQTLPDDVLACEVCDDLACLRCYPDFIYACAGEPIYHCHPCGQDCPACQQDRRDAMGVDAEREQ